MRFRDIVWCSIFAVLFGLVVLMLWVGIVYVFGLGSLMGIAFR
jgi:hypothetical protein